MGLTDFTGEVSSVLEVDWFEMQILHPYGHTDREMNRYMVQRSGEKSKIYIHVCMYI